jgi:DNA-directed RNA polymerase subunit RPC12/RpoP
MTDVVFNCSRCNRSLQINAIYAGTAVSCPQCKAPVIVPHQIVGRPFTSVAARPTSITVLGVLNIVLGSLGLLCLPLVIAAEFVPREAFALTALPREWQMISTIIAPFAFVWLAATGVGLLRLRKWARLGAVAYGWFAIAFGTVQLCVIVATYIVNMYDVASGVRPLQPEYVTATMLGGLLAGFVALVYPLLLVVLLSRPRLIHACYK